VEKQEIYDCGCTNKVKELGAGGVGVLCANCKNDKHIGLSTGNFVP
jgi:hypothetical protein